MLRDYRIDLSSLLQMPKKHFFWLYNMRPRLRAEENLNLLKVLVASQSTPETFDKVAAEWQEEVGVIFQEKPISTPKVFVVDENALDPEFDREGLRALKFKHGA